MQQPWVQRVKWLNADDDAQLDHDFECIVDDSEGFGRSHIEVKTRWRGCRRAAPSQRQACRLSDPEDDYMLLVVGNFRNLFVGAKPEPPVVRCLPNVLVEHLELPMEYVNFVIGKSGKNVKRIEEESKAKVQIVDDGGVYEIRISAVERCAMKRAIHLVEETFVIISVTIPRRSVGKVIGRKGATVQSLRKRTGTRIQLKRIRCKRSIVTCVSLKKEQVRVQKAQCFSHWESYCEDGSDLAHFDHPNARLRYQ